MTDRDTAADPVREVLEEAAVQIEARDALLVSYRLGRLSKKANRLIDKVNPAAVANIRAVLERRSEDASAPLFQAGDFTLASGQHSNWRINGPEALTDADWIALAEIADERFGLQFGRAVGVPTGGERFARAMQEGATDGPVLVCDDVLTTGGSLKRVMNEHPGSIGLVAFARGPVPEGVHAIWTLAEDASADSPCPECGGNGEVRCHSGRDGDCSWGSCPQLRDGEPSASGRSCPYALWGDEEEQSERHPCLVCQPTGDEGESLADQIDRLACFIMDEVPGEPSQSQGAVDTAIRWMRAALQSAAAREQAQEYEYRWLHEQFESPSESKAVVDDLVRRFGGTMERRRTRQAMVTVPDSPWEPVPADEEPTDGNT